MTISTDNTVIWDGKSYFGGDQIGLTPDGTFVISLYTTPPPNPRGSYFTTIPISSKSYRDKHETLCGVRDDGNSVTVYTDYGYPQKIIADRTVLDAILRECAEHRIPLITQLYQL